MPIDFHGEFDLERGCHYIILPKSMFLYGDTSNVKLEACVRYSFAKVLLCDFKFLIYMYISMYSVAY